jgi:hypothetical protein
MSDIRSSGSSDMSPSEITMFTIWLTVFCENKLEICNKGRTRITCSHTKTMDHTQTVSIVHTICWINKNYSINSLSWTLKVHHSVHKWPYGLQIMSAVATGNFLRYFTKYREIKHFHWLGYR